MFERKCIRLKWDKVLVGVLHKNDIIFKKNRQFELTSTDSKGRIKIVHLNTFSVNDEISMTLIA